MSDGIILPTRRLQATDEEARAGDDATFWITPATLGAEIARRTTVAAVAAAQVLAHRVVVDAGGGVAHADATVPDHATRVLGITLTSAAAGAEVRLSHQGEVSNPGWSFTPRAPLYLGSNGTLTEAVPVNPPAVFHLAVGLALAPDRILVRFGAPIMIGD